MKKLFLFFCLIFLISSCNRELDITLDENIVSSPQTFHIQEYPYTIDYNGVKVTFEIEDSTNIQLRTGYGPTQYSYLDMQQITNSKKEVISRNCSPYQGIYFVSIFHFTKQISMPAGAIAAKVILPSGYNKTFIKAETQEYGAGVTLNTTNQGIRAVLSFYTLRIEYTAGGQSVGKVFPMDGRNVQVGYQFFYE